MKKFLNAVIWVILLALLAITATAQNYQPFRKNLTYQFIAQDTIYSLRVDSAKVASGDSVFVFNQIVRRGIIRTGPTYCIGTNSPYHIQRNNLFGYSMKRQPNREYVLKAAQGNEFLLKTQVPIGTSWTFCPNPLISATLIASAPETFSGVTDQVLTYSLSNGTQIKLSQNYGFVQIPILMGFIPNSGFPNKNLNMHKLPEARTANSTPLVFKYFDFQPGDKFSFLTDTMHAIMERTWDQYHVITRSSSPLGDTLFYMVEHTRLFRRSSIFFPTSAVLSPPQNLMWVISRYDHEEDLQLLTNGFTKSGSAFHNQGTILSSTSSSALFNNRERNYYRNSRFDFTDPCSTFFLSFSTTHFGNKFEFTPGLGKTGEWCSLATSFHTQMVLEAYIKGTETYGTWPDLTQMYSQIMGRKPEKAPTAFSVFPNPFTSEVTLQFSHSFSAGKASVSISNVLGQEVLKREITVTAGQENKLELGQLPKGMYVLKAEQNGKVFTTRLVKE